MSRRLLCSLALLTASAVAAGCGGPSEEERAREAAEQRAERQERRERAEFREQRARYGLCVSTFAGLQAAVEELDSRLNVGLSFNDYTGRVADVRVAYDQTEFDELDDPPCLQTVGVPLERALNQYVRAATIWEECFEDFDCEMDSAEPEMQEHWQRASNAAERAAAASDSLEPTPPSTSAQRAVAAGDLDGLIEFCDARRDSGTTNSIVPSATAGRVQAAIDAYEQSSDPALRDTLQELEGCAPQIDALLDEL